MESQLEKSTQKKYVKSNKNSLIEFMRFLFALWVLYYHDFVPYRYDAFSEGYLAVEFFFVLSGFFIMRSINKYISMPLKQGLFTLLKHRFKAIAIPFLIAEVFVLIYSLGFDFSYNFLFGYMWYVRDLFLAMAGLFLLRKYIKNNKTFYILLAAISGLVFAFRWPGGAFRSVACMPLGIFSAMIPEISVKIKEKENKFLSRFFLYSGLVITAAASFFIIMSNEKTATMRYCLVVFGYPALLYFANQIKFNSRLLNWLGSLSFPIYAFQCILRVLEALGYTQQTFLFIILVLTVISFSFIMNLIEKKKKENR